MEKLLKLLGLPKTATEDDAIEAVKKLKDDAETTIKELKSKLKDKPPLDEEREELIKAKMRDGLNREIATEAVDNQIADDARKEKEGKNSKK